MTVSVQPELRIEYRECAADADHSATCSLTEQEVHTWHALLHPAPAEVSRLRQVLSDDEQQRAGRFRFEKGRSEFIFVRGTLRVLLGAYVGVSPNQLRFAYSTHGKPSLATPAGGPSLSFNVCHTEGMAMFAFTRHRRVGVDVEQVRRDFEVEEIAERFFSPAERLALHNFPQEQRYEAFFRCWTRKEAYIKARGEGLSLPLHQFDVSLAPDDLCALLGTRPDPQEAERWQLRTLPVASGYAAALAVEANTTPNVQS